MDRSRLRSIRTHVWRPILALVRLTARLFTWGGVQRLGRWCGEIAWLTSRVNRRRALDHLAIAFPEMPPGERKAIAREAFRQQLMGAAELLHVAGRGADELYDRVDVEGFEHAEQALASGRPVVLVTGHCGNWELLPTAFHRRGVTLAAIVRKAKEEVLETLLTDLRGTFGTRLVHRGESGSVRHLLAVLRGGTALIMLIDQDFRTEGVWVPFFGKLAHTPVGPARLVLRRNAIALPAFMERLDDGRHRTLIGPPFELPDDPTAATALMSRAVEEQIRRAPAQWVWWHRRWRRRPGGHNT